jgi:hypothetical protein
MSTTEPTPPEDQPSFRIFSRTSAIVVAVAACVFFAGLIVCGGTLALPVYLQRQRRAEAEARRAQAVENLKRLGQAMQQKSAEQGDAERPESTQAGDDATEPIEPE